MVRSSLALGIVTLSLCSGVVYAGEQPAPRTITVSGSAQVGVVPDEVVLTLRVESVDKDPRKAKADSDARIKKVLALAQEFSLDPKDIQTDLLSIERRWQQDTFIGYAACNDVCVRLKDLTKVEQLLGRAIDVGGALVQSIQFRTTEYRKHADAARAAALKAAKEKATAMAAELDQKLGRPTSIAEEKTPSNRWSSNPYSNVAWVEQGDGGSEPSIIAPGQIVIRASVSVTFELE